MGHRAGRAALATTLAATMYVIAGCGNGAQDRASDPDATTGAEAAASAIHQTAEDRLNVVATTTIVGDIVSRVGGDAISLIVLLPPGADPHGFEPTPRDVAAVADADVVFVNGLGLEANLEPLLESAGASSVVSLSDGIEVRYLGETDTGHADSETDHEDEHADADEAPEHDRGADPHVWFDPTNIMAWTDNAERTLSGLDPDNAQSYNDNAAAVHDSLAELDRWIENQVASIPPDSRQLVTDHETLGYLTQRYGLQQLGTLHGFSTMSEPSASDLAEIEDAIRAFDVPAIFVGNTVNPDLGRRVAADTNTRIVTLFTGSLSETGGNADSYEAFMRFNVGRIADALAPGAEATSRP